MEMDRQEIARISGACAGCQGCSRGQIPGFVYCSWLVREVSPTRGGMCRVKAYDPDRFQANLEKYQGLKAAEVDFLDRHPDYEVYKANGSVHAPQHCYDCSRCKFAWNCGPKCACNMVQLGLPPATGERAQQVRAAHIEVWAGNATLELSGVID